MEHKFSKGYRAIQRQQKKPSRRGVALPTIRSHSSSGGGKSAMPFITLPSYRSTIGYYERRKNRWLLPVITSGILIMLLGLGYLLFLSPLFTLTIVNVEGTTRIPPDLVRGVVQEHTNQTKRWWYLPGNNLFLIDEYNIRQHLEAWVDTKSVRLKKQFPHTLIITIQERVPVLVWQINDERFMLDEEGIILKTLTAADSFDRLIAWTQATGVTARTGKLGDALIPAPYAQALTQALAMAAQTVGAPIMVVNFQYGDEQNVVFKTSEGWDIYFLLADWQNALARLKLLLTQADAPNRTQLEYIDVRYENRIFTKQKEKTINQENNKSRKQEGLP